MTSPTDAPAPLLTARDVVDWHNTQAMIASEAMWGERRRGLSGTGWAETYRRHSDFLNAIGKLLATLAALKAENARLREGLSGALGLIELVRGRDDLPGTVAASLSDHNWRMAEARAALAADEQRAESIFAEPTAVDAALAYVSANPTLLERMYAERYADEVAINSFAQAMVDKMARSRAKGRSGWQNCPISDLWRMLRKHVEKGDPVDVANFAMMIHANQQREEDAR